MVRNFELAMNRFKTMPDSARPGGNGPILVMNAPASVVSCYALEEMKITENPTDVPFTHGQGRPSAL
jgi:hypothetical protein